VKGDRSADSRLLTKRWLNDRQEAAVDPDHSGNMFSFYYRSRLDIHVRDSGLRARRRFHSENLRSGKGLVRDCERVPFNYLDVVTSPDRPRFNRFCPIALSGSGHRCVPRRVRVSAKRIGPARLGSSFKKFFRRYRAVKRKRAATRFCVRRGGKFWVGSRKGKIDFVATTAKGHRTRRLGPGRRFQRARIAGTRRIRSGLFVSRKTRKGRVLYGLRRHRIRFLATVSRRQARKRRSLVRRLRAVRLVPRARRHHHKR
jgi:hypothetical protein